MEIYNSIGKKFTQMSLFHFKFFLTVLGLPVFKYYIFFYIFSIITYASDISYTPILKIKRAPFSCLMLDKNTPDSLQSISIVSPYEVPRVPDHHSALFLHTFFLLQEKNLSVLSSIFLPVLTEWFTKLESISEDVIETIEFGKIPKEILEKDI